MQSSQYGDAPPKETATRNGDATGVADLVSIVRFSRMMEVALGIVLVLVPLGLGLLTLIFSEQLRSLEILGTFEAAPGPLALPWKLAAFGVLLLCSTPLLYAVNAARLMFLNFRHGVVFTPRTAIYVRRIALGLLVQAFVAPLGGMALSAILSGAGKAHGLVLAISSDQIWIALFAFIFLGLARVMHAAALLAEDNAAIV
jgi:hypothetical protein